MSSLAVMVAVAMATVGIAAKGSPPHIFMVLIDDLGYHNGVSLSRTHAHALHVHMDCMPLQSSVALTHCLAYPLTHSRTQPTQSLTESLINS